MKKKIGLLLLVILVGIQFIPAGFENPEVVEGNDFLVINQAPENVKEIIRTSCYDCHSNESEYPWYSKISPVKFWLKEHIEDGRRHLNFSEWGQYDEERKAHKLEECIEEVEERHMPLDSYLWMHSDAKLSDEQIVTLVEWWQTL